MYNTLARHQGAPLTLTAGTLFNATKLPHASGSLRLADALDGSQNELVSVFDLFA